MNRITWDEFFEKLAKAGLSYLNIGEDSEGLIRVTLNLREVIDEGGRYVLEEVDE